MSLHAARFPGPRRFTDLPTASQIGHVPFRDRRLTLEPVALRVERARHQGREAFLAGESRLRCPYAFESPERRAWETAWDDAYQFRVALTELWRRQG